MHRQSCCKPSVWMNPLPVLVAAQPTPKQKKPQTRRELAVDLGFGVGVGYCLGISRFLEWVVRVTTPLEKRDQQQGTHQRPPTTATTPHPRASGAAPPQKFPPFLSVLSCRALSRRAPPPDRVIADSLPDIPAPWDRTGVAWLRSKWRRTVSFKCRVALSCLQYPMNCNSQHR
jgi:hypothetical protein